MVSCFHRLQCTHRVWSSVRLRAGWLPKLCLGFQEAVNSLSLLFWFFLPSGILKQLWAVMSLVVLEARHVVGER